MFYYCNLILKFRIYFDFLDFLYLQSLSEGKKTGGRDKLK